MIKELPAQNHWVRALVLSDKFLYSGSYQAIKVTLLSSFLPPLTLSFPSHPHPHSLLLSLTSLPISSFTSSPISSLPHILTYFLTHILTPTSLSLSLSISLYLSLSLSLSSSHPHSLLSLSSLSLSSLYM